MLVMLNSELIPSPLGRLFKESLMSIKNTETLSSLINRAQKRGTITRISVMMEDGELPGLITCSGGGAIAAFTEHVIDEEGDVLLGGEYVLHCQTWQEAEARAILGL
jgi:ABC-type lipopolysaccharide export system ATPase subunit